MSSRTGSKATQGNLVLGKNKTKTTKQQTQLEIPLIGPEETLYKPLLLSSLQLAQAEAATLLSVSLPLNLT